ncbi:peptidylprolyl isomerase [Candidatus Nomurabacteria bacterium]|nr:peptidylprolyl isomerase [Candidatus Nomurabacteria bacterium]
MSNQIATFKTNKGEFKIELFGDKAPKTVENFVTLANQGFYNNTKFHRIIADFMIQGGDPLTKDDSQMTRWGTGGPDYRFADEFGEGLSNVTGTISMANAGPNTNGSQFFINVADNTFLDGKHAVFGKVIEGMDLVMQLSKVETGERDVPVSPVVVESVSISQ